MKVSRGLFVFLFPVLLLQFMGCDTPGKVESPAKNYFVKFYGDDGAHTGADMVTNPDGTMVLFGTITQPDKKTRLYVVKVDAYGNLLKQTILGDSLLVHEARDIELLPDHYLAVLGNVFTSPTNRDILLMILDPDLNVKAQYVQNYTAGTDLDEDAMSVSPTSDGFIVAGSTGNLQGTDPNRIREGLFLRFLDDGTHSSLTIPSPLDWPAKPSGGQGSENVITRIFQLADGNFYGFGYSKWHGRNGPQPDFNLWYFSLSETGQIGGGADKGAFSIGTSGTDEKLFSVATPWPLAGDSTFFLGGIITDISGNDDVYVAKLKSRLQFTDSLNIDLINISPKPFGLQLLKPTIEWVSTCHTGNSYLILTNENSSGSNNLLLTKINSFDGLVPWTTPLIYGGVGDDFAGSVSESLDGKILIIGTMAIGQKDGETKMVLMKVNKDGKFAD